MTQLDRFYIDHGMIHDRLTGRHVTTDETVLVDGKPVHGQPDIVDCCNLLNQLASNQAKPLVEQGCVNCNPIKRSKLLGNPCEGVSVSVEEANNG